MEITKDNKMICIAQNYWQMILKDCGRLHRCSELSLQYSKRIQNITLSLERIDGEPHVRITKNDTEISLPLQLWDKKCIAISNNDPENTYMKIEVQRGPQGVVMKVIRGQRYVVLSEKSIGILYEIVKNYPVD